MRIEPVLSNLLKRIAFALLFQNSYNFDRAGYDAMRAVVEQIEAEHPEWKADA
jgi:hypothetical protein